MTDHPPPAAPPSASRMLWIDQLRVLACLAVVFIHVTGPAYARFHDGPWWEWWLANLMSASSRASVPVFMMISGALMRERDCDAAGFYQRKALRFIPVIVAWTALYAVFDVVVMGYTVKDVALEFISRGYVYLHLWYLAMFACMLAFAPFLARFRFSVPFSRGDGWWLGALCVAFVSIDWGFHLACRALGVVFHEWTRTFLVFIPCFLLGAWLPAASVNRRWWKFVLAAALAASWLANYLSCRFLGVIDDSMPLAFHSPLVLVVAVAVFLLAKSGARSSEKSPRWLAAAGEASLGIYLLHPLFIWLFQRLLRGSGHDLLAGWWMPVTAAAAFLASFACIHLLRRLPWGTRIC